MKVVSWNVLSLHRVGALNNLVEEIKNCNLDVTALQEVRRRKSGEHAVEGMTLLYSGNITRHMYGVGFCLTLITPTFFSSQNSGGGSIVPPLRISLNTCIKNMKFCRHVY